MVRNLQIVGNEKGRETMTTYRLVMQEDMNHYGFLFGGKMLMWIDEGGNKLVLRGGDEP